jgi:hypothetical protein
VLSRLKNKNLRWLAEIIILHDPAKDPVFTCSPEKWRNVPTHKSLFSVPVGKGLPIGNFQQEDVRVTVPEVLRPMVGKDVIRR